MKLEPVLFVPDAHHPFADMQAPRWRCHGGLASRSRPKWLAAAAAKQRHGSSSLRSAAPPSLGAGAGHSFLPPDRRLGRSATPSRSNLPWSAELPTPSEAKTPSFGGTGGLFGCHADCDCIIVYSAVSSTPMTDGRHALCYRSLVATACRTPTLKRLCMRGPPCKLPTRHFAKSAPRRGAGRDAGGAGRGC